MVVDRYGTDEMLRCTLLPSSCVIVSFSSAVGASTLPISLTILPLSPDHGDAVFFVEPTLAACQSSWSPHSACVECACAAGLQGYLGIH